MTQVKSTPALRFPGFEGEWEVQPLEKLTTRIGDGIHTTPKYDDNGEYFFINGNNLLNGGIIISDSTKRINESEFKIYNRNLGENTILMSINGTIGNLAFYDSEKVVLGKSAAYINLKSDVNKHFIFNYLQTDQAKRFYESELTGSTIKNLSLKTLKETKAPNPTPSEQQKVAAFLSAIDNWIKLLKQKKEKLQAYKNGVLQQIFSQQIRFKDENGNNFPEWEEKSLQTLTSRIGDGLHTTPKYDEEGEYYFINGNNLLNGRIIFSENTKRVNKREFELHSRNLSNRSLLMSINGTIGNLAYYKNEEVILGKSAAYINLKDNVDIDFIYYSLQTKRIIDFFNSELTGSTIGNLSLKTIRETVILVPSISEQQKIASFLTSLDKAIEAVQAQIDRSAEFKKGLLQQLFV